MEVSIETKNIRMPEHVVSALLAYRQDESIPQVLLNFYLSPHLAFYLTLNDFCLMETFEGDNKVRRCLRSSKVYAAEFTFTQRAANSERW